MEIQPINSDVSAYRTLRQQLFTTDPFTCNADPAIALQSNDEFWNINNKRCLDNPDNQRFIAWDNETPIGVANVLKHNTGTAEIGGLYVLPPYRRQKVGSLLLASCIDFALQRHAHRAAGWLLDENTAAQELLSACNFELALPMQTRPWWNGMYKIEKLWATKLT